MSSVRSHILRFILNKTSNWNKPLEERRQKLERDASRSKIPTDIKISPINIDTTPAELIVPQGVDKNKIILYLHGGGYCMGSCITHRPLMSNIAIKSRVGGLLLDYRLAPEYTFPAALEDSTAAYKWLLKEGFLPHNIVIAGDSAGGGLALATLISLRDDNFPLPAAGVCISPWTDLKGESMRTTVGLDPLINQPDVLNLSKLYVGDKDPTFPLISPLYADPINLPPLLIHVGADEVLLNDSTQFADNAKRAGVDVTIKVWENMWHSFHLFAPLLPEASNAIEEIGTYINDRIGKIQ